MKSTPPCAREQCGGKAVTKHHAAGKLTIRERIHALLDPLFQEIGKRRCNYDQDGTLTHSRRRPMSRHR
jgi:acetyl-CoA carboxylase carboxyltransferase component